MPNAPGGQTSATNFHHDSPHNTPGDSIMEQRVMALEREAYARSQQKLPDELTTVVKRGEWWLIGLQAATFIAVIITAAIYYAQLKEMVGASGQTDVLTLAYRHLANSSGRQADAAKILAQQAVTQAIQTTNLAGDTHTLAIEAGKQADASRRLADLTYKQVTLNQEVAGSQRAAVIVDVAQVLTPLTFHGASMSAAFSIAVRNIGRSPAKIVALRFKPSFVQWGESYFREPLKRQSELCDKSPTIIDKSGPLLQKLLTENDIEQFQINYGTSISSSDIVSWPPSGPHESNRVTPIVVGCIDYQSESMPDPHQTGFIFEIQQNFGRLPIIGVDIPIDQVVVTKYVFAQGKSY